MWSLPVLWSFVYNFIEPHILVNYLSKHNYRYIKYKSSTRTFLRILYYKVECQEKNYNEKVKFYYDNFWAQLTCTCKRTSNWPAISKVINKSVIRLCTFIYRKRVVTKTNHPNLPGTNPLYCPKGSGYLSLIFHTQQEGITLLSPAPSRPWDHKMYCL